MFCWFERAGRVLKPRRSSAVPRQWPPTPSAAVFYPWQSRLPGTHNNNTAGWHTANVVACAYAYMGQTPREAFFVRSRMSIILYRPFSFLPHGFRRQQLLTGAGPCPFHSAVVVLCCPSCMLDVSASFHMCIHLYLIYSTLLQ